jgi:predicted lysophospholipase L1 biosynthesis ABC-type transport system permease subunit
MIAELQQMVRVVIIASLVIAGCSLAVSVAAGVSDRKRPFSLLRLTGVQLGVLRRVVALEAAVPLLLTAVVAVGTGLLGAELFLRSQLGESLRAPGLGYFVIVVAGLIASLGIIAATLPLIERITGPEVARNG